MPKKRNDVLDRGIGSGQKMKDAGNARKELYLEALRNGASPRDAAIAAGVSPNTAKNAWAKDKDFAARRRVVKASLRNPIYTSDGRLFPDFLTFREKFFCRQNFWYTQNAYDALQANDRLVMLVPPRHGKTTAFSIEYSAYLLFKCAATDPDRGYRITVLQKSQDEAKKVVRSVKALLSDHGYYERMGIPTAEDPITLYGGDGLKPERETGAMWGSEAFYLAGGYSGEKDPNMQAKGASSSILGNRADLIIVDDIQDPRNQSQTHVRALVRFLQQDVLSRLGPESRILFLGSRIGPNDVWAAIMEEEWAEGWPVVRYPAVLDDAKKRQLAPDLWPWTALMRAKKEAGPSWYSTWMQEDGGFEDAVFDKKKMQDARNADYRIGEIPPQVTSVFMGCDPAISQYCAITVWGLDQRTGQRYLIDQFNEKGMRTFTNIQSQIVHMAGRYEARVCAIEMNNVQGSIADDTEFRRAMARVGTRITKYQTRTETGARAESDTFDISSIGALFDAGLITLPYADAETRRKTDAYIGQLAEWRPGVKNLTRDMVMSTLFAESEAHALAARSFKDRTVSRARALPDWVSRDGKFPWTKRQAPEFPQSDPIDRELDAENERLNA